MSQYLPIRTDAFIGRASELEATKRGLSGSRIVTIAGPGGIGKTRLALEVAKEVGPMFTDGARFADLSLSVDEHEVARAVAASFGVTGSSSDDVRSVATFLQEASALLVLDSCERCVHASATLVNEVLRSCPGLVVLATSRSILGVAGETVLQLPPLQAPEIRRLPNIGASRERLQHVWRDAEAQLRSVEALDPAKALEFEAIRLFEDRARSGAAWFEVTSDNAAAVAILCARLDAIPLALELAAARVRSMSIEDIVKRLDDRFRLLVSTGRFDGARHRSLRSAIDWSYEMLGIEERLLFQRLSVFAGGWTLEAAEEVCSGAGVQRETICDIVGRLVDHSMVTFMPTDAPPYRMLDTLREYARTKLGESREKALIERRYVTWAVARAETYRAQCRLPGAGAPGETLALDAGNILEAANLASELRDRDSFLRLFASIGRYWFGQISAIEARRWATACFEASARHPSPSLVAALTHAGFIELRIGDNKRARALLYDAVRLGREIADRHSLGEALWVLGVLHGEEGATDEARNALEEALQIARGTGSQPDMPGLLIGTLNALGHIESIADVESYELPEKLWIEAVDASERLGVPHLGWEAMGNLGEVARSRGEYELARRRYLESSSIALQLGNKAGRGVALLNLASVLVAMGDWREAANYLKEFFDSDRELGIPPELKPAVQGEGWKRSRLAWRALAILGGVLLLARRPEEAARILAAAQLRQGTVDPLDLRDQEEIRDALIGELGQSLFDRESEAGRKLQARDVLEWATAILGQVRSANASTVSHGAESLPRLSAREHEVLRMLAAGMSNRAIADNLFLSTRTVETHIASLYTKIGARNRVQAARWAADAGVLA